MASSVVAPDAPFPAAVPFSFRRQGGADALDTVRTQARQNLDTFQITIAALAQW